MTTPRLPANLPRLLEEFGGELLGIPKCEWTANGATTAAAAVPFSLIVNEAIDAGVPAQGWLTTANGEVLHYSAVNTATKTFTIDARAQQGTTAAAIDNATAVAQYLTRDQWNQVVDELIAAVTTGVGSRGAAIASAATLNLTDDGDYFEITGTTAVTAISARRAGAEVVLRFSGALTLTHNAASLILRGAANVTTAAGDVFVLRSEGGGNWREVGRLTAGIVAGGTTHTFVRKTADESVSSSTVLQDDDALLFAVGANEVWEFLFAVNFGAGASGNPDFKVGITGPAGSTVRWSPSGAYHRALDDFASLPRVNASGASIDVSADNGETGITLRGIIVNGANAGNCKLQWAQVTSNADPISVKANSYLRAHKIA